MSAVTALPNALVIPDLHCPYHHPDALDFLADQKRKLKPRLIFCIGDEIDAHSVSRYHADPDLPSPAEELRLARESLRPLFRLFPAARVCRSNHTERAYKKAYASGLPSAYLRQIADVLEAPTGWQWAQSWTCEGVRFIHGEPFSGVCPARTAVERLRCSVVLGHVHHAACVHYLHGVADRLFGFSVGCLIHPTSPAFSYAVHCPARPALGCGVIEDGVPRFVPL